MKPNKTWNPTKYPGLYKHANGTYYVRVGRKTWRSLKTKVLAVALKSREEVLREVERQEDDSAASLQLDGTKVKHAVKVIRWRILHDPSLKPNTRVYSNDLICSLTRSWKGFEEMELNEIKLTQCEEWAGIQSRKWSANYYNNSMGMLRRIFDIGIEAGLMSRNPAAGLKRAKYKHKDLLTRLPSRSQFQEFVEVIANSHSRWRRASADLVEFLAYSGARIGEAREVCWKHIDWGRNELVIVGDESGEGTKNRKTRRVPMNDSLLELLKTIRRKFPNEGAEDKVLKVRTAERSMRNAADKLKIERFTHHDLRHLFATTCIESGVPIPTVAYWLGHSDGGALALKVYGHLRNEHSKAAAEMVSFH
ncbi:MAG: site-specific integrase [Verrucomicrobiales bacterium]|nr:site-specific integrase [Verrucomicrobiales bacterium]